MTSAAGQLVGMELDGGWRVVELVKHREGSTGGHFSSGYIVENSIGERAFLKALDYSSALKSPDPALALKGLTEAYVFERDLLVKCKDRRMDRVVQAITHGSVRVLEAPEPNIVQYIVCELADRDARAQLDLGKEFDVAWALRSLHHIATGLMQLHRKWIAHQDLKPSNVLIFGDQTSKLTDLGRAADKEGSSPFDSLNVAGDRGYAPPELLYNFTVPDWTRRRVGCDLYLLGSMIVFFFSRASMTGLIMSELAEGQRWINWSDDYVSVLPYIRDAFDRAVLKFKEDLPDYLCEVLEPAVRELCEPDPNRRGKSQYIEPLRQYSLESYVSLFDYVARKAEYGLFRS